MRFRPLLVSSVLVAPMGLAACDPSHDAGQAAAPPPPVVKTMVLTPADVPLHAEYPGRLAPIRLAEVRARVSGIVLARTFTEGSDVKAGDVLFEIDPAKFAAAVTSARAQLLRTEANLLLASQQLDRIQRLSGTNVTSRGQLDIAFANREQAEAEVSVAKANLQTAELELGYASIRSPIAGRIGQAMVTEGALARQEDGTHMATVRDLSAVYVDFTAPLADLSKVRGDIAARGSDRAGKDIAVELLTDDGGVQPNRGRLLFSSASVNESTGLVWLRAEFSNPDRTLLPGTYVRVRMTQGVERQALLVPQRAVQRDTLGQASVVVVTNGLASMRPVTTGRALNGRWLVTDGLKPGDRIVVEGIERAIPGSPVTPEAIAETGAGDLAASRPCAPPCRERDKG